MKKDINRSFKFYSYSIKYFSVKCFNDREYGVG